jgi:hypothetical protein
MECRSSDRLGLRAPVTINAEPWLCVGSGLTQKKSPAVSAFQNMILSK